jgi:hypothetical protein
MSPLGLVFNPPLSTAFSPLTPVAPPADVLIVSQPAPSGWHLIVGITGVGATAGAAGGALARAVGSGSACGPANALFGAFVGLAVVGAVDDVTTGPLRSEQPLAHPVATGPTNVGADGL